MKDKLIILVSGRAGVGKTTLSNLLKKGFVLDKFNAEIFSFAETIKEIAFLDFMWNKNKDMDGRKLLQDLGRIGREYNENIWVNYAIDKIKYSNVPVCIIDDWRFPNELKRIKEVFNKVYTIRVESKSRELLIGTPEYNDISEISLPGFDTASHNLRLYGTIVFNEKIKNLESLAEIAKVIVDNLIIEFDLRS